MFDLSKPLPDPPPGYRRELVKVQTRTVVHSRCEYCGMEITGSVSEVLKEIEEKHRELCLAPRINGAPPKTLP